jgi:hypothetical protein
MGFERPPFDLLNVVYGCYKNDPAPCKHDNIPNQCAVRLSLAMVRCGFSLELFEPQSRIHQGRESCQLDDAHVVGADEFQRYLITVWETGLKGKGGEIKEAIQGKPGIVYFDNCFKRAGESARRGDHIDLWTGEKFYNQIIYLKAGGDATPKSDLFARADFVRFFWLP